MQGLSAGSSLSRRDVSPEAAAHFYKLPNDPPRFEPCQPAGLCLGRNVCNGTSQGIMCAQCIERYARIHLNIAGDSTCSKCHDFTWNIFLIILTVALYSLYIWAILKATLSAGRSIRRSIP